jgi:ATP-binding cassette subfamily B protein
MNYNLNDISEKKHPKKPFWVTLAGLLAFIREERRMLIYAFVAIFINAWLSLIGPYIIGYTIDVCFKNKDYHGILLYSGILLALYLLAFVANYLQMVWMGGVGQRLLYSLRNSLFSKIQSLPVDFFNQNKSGDLISRINNDTDKVNQFFSQSLMQFVGHIVTMVGAAIFLLSINFKLGLAALAPAFGVWVFTKAISPWVKKRNAVNLKNSGGLSAEVQESIHNFKVIVAFNRRDYFRKRFEEANSSNYKSALQSGYAGNIFLPVYSLAANLGQLIVLAYGIYQVIHGEFSVGLLISYIAYVLNFYNPMRQMAALWSGFQLALAAWDRISVILALKSNLNIETNISDETSDAYVSFRNVSFKYPNGKEVLHRVSFDLQRGKTYAFVGPTGGGKTTTASLLARLYDATKGSVLLDGRDIRSYPPDERARKIGFILQDPFLFTGTVRENILYGNRDLQDLTNSQLVDVLRDSGLEKLLQRFDHGLDTPVQASGDSISLGQKQLIAFMRAVLRKPELLILDEATANIDTVTESLLDEILKRLPETTTRVIIAHRLNTIENADEIYFVNSGKVQRAGSLDDSVNLLLHGKRES